MTLNLKIETLQKQKARIDKKIKDIERSEAFKKEQRIIKDLERIAKKHSCSKKTLSAILEQITDTPNKREIKRRELKIYKNPETGETLATRGGNHKILKAWKEEYGLKRVEEWLTETRD